MNIVIFEDAGWRNLLPLVWLRATCEICCGRDRLLDKVLAAVPGKLLRLFVRPELHAVVAARNALSEGISPVHDAPVLLVNGRALVSGRLTPPRVGCGWMIGGALVAATITLRDLSALDEQTFLDGARCAEWMNTLLDHERPPADVRLIDYPWQPALFNATELARQLTHSGGQLLGRVYGGVHRLRESAIHVAEGAVIKPGVVLDAEGGPIHVAEGAEIQPNAVLQGPCYVGAGAIIRPQAVIRAGTTIGPCARVGGEVEGSILQGWCNKQHSGFVGHSYVCPWVNLGADTVTSDLKNTYGTIRVSLSGVRTESGERFIGSIIGDHAKTGIGTLLPTGCVIGVAANVFSQCGVPAFVPSFGWLTNGGLTDYRVDKAIEIARIVQERRKVPLTADDAALLEYTACAARREERADSAG